MASETTITRTQVKDRSGLPFWVQKVGDRYFPDFDPWKDRDCRDLLSLIKTLQVRPDDVFVYGMPKSGNHWIHEILNMVSRQSSEYLASKFTDDILELKNEEMFAEVDKKPSPRVIPSHFPLDLAPAQIPEKGAKVVLLVRNLKDVTVSTFTFLHCLKKYVVYKGKWEDFFEMMLSPAGFVYGTWCDYIRHAENFRKQNPEVPFHVVCYELLKTDPIKEISKLCQFMGHSDTLAAEIADKVSFKAMRDVLMDGKYGDFVREACEPDTPGLFRKGEIGDWKNYFTVAQSQRVDDMIEEQLGDSQIAQMMKPFM